MGATTHNTGDRRVCFDFEVEFSNGGGLQGQDFRLDLDGEDVSDRELGEYVIRDLRLLMVGAVRILNKRVIFERHKRGAVAHGADAVEGPRAELFDLSHPIRDGQMVFPGLPAPRIGEHMSHAASRERYAAGVSFQIGKVEMVANTGTSIDAPFHRYPGGCDIADLPLASIADLDAVVVRLGGMQGRAIHRAALAAVEVRGRAVLLDTGRARLWGSDGYALAAPYLTRDGAEFLRDRGAALVGIDALNIDDTDDPSRPAHSILLGAGIPIVENLADLQRLPAEGLRFSAAPMRISGIGAFPVRAWARLA